MKTTILTLLVVSISLITNANGIKPQAILVSNKWQLHRENKVDEKIHLIGISTTINNPRLEAILISKIWKIDSESIDKVMLKSKSNSKIEAMSNDEKEITFSSMELAMKGVRFQFLKDAQFVYKIVALGKELINYKGTFTINKEKNEITTNTEIEPNQVYKIISAEENKIYLHHIQRNIDFILVPTNN